MNRTLEIEQHIIEAWGLWWIQWQKDTKERLQKISKSPQGFVNEHLTELKGLLGDSTGGLILPSK